MSDTENDANAEQFWKLADSFINLANEHYEQEGDCKVGYAAARFNAFIVATTARDKANLIAEKEQAISYFTEHHQKMFSENFEDCEESFNQN